MNWTAGVTTVQQRADSLLPRTLASLAQAGWDAPILFVDHHKNAYANWWLGMQHLYVRNPSADRYLMVQDDVVFVKGLREYLEASPWPGRGYLSLYANDVNLRDGVGFHRTPCKTAGLGALALVFNRDSIIKLLSSEFLLEKFRPNDDQPQRARKGIDSGVAHAMRLAGMSQWCHSPSLVQHAGEISTMGNTKVVASSFPGEDFDLRTLLKKDA